LHIRIRKKEKGRYCFLNSGIFYEFIKNDEFYTDNPKRYTIGEELGGIMFCNFTNAGLWGYNITYGSANSLNRTE
jgi:hypothetical protein